MEKKIHVSEHYQHFLFKWSTQRSVHHRKISLYNKNDKSIRIIYKYLQPTGFHRTESRAKQWTSSLYLSNNSECLKNFVRECLPIIIFIIQTYFYSIQRVVIFIRAVQPVQCQWFTRPFLYYKLVDVVFSPEISQSSTSLCIRVCPQCPNSIP